ncbi:MAG: hypothetical protein EZS28_013075 [Streblomastix strix]|uniref:Uncharacterized protein n=1 Tax=Streblomastix strix TaxID=222440 RepID=A0A5J4W8Y9_9EUKA|nr:MAG: hypothetical protein EZS28_013075 [Streblomastix strix]
MAEDQITQKCARSRSGQQNWVGGGDEEQTESVGSWCGCVGEAVFDEESAGHELLWLLCCDMCKGVYTNAQLLETNEGNQLACVLANGSIVPVARLEAACGNLNQTLLHIQQNTGMTKSELLQASLLVSRVWQKEPAKVSPATLQALVVGACVVAHKLNTDVVRTNGWWSAMLGVGIESVNAMEREILTALGFALHVTAEEFGQLERVFDSRISVWRLQGQVA